MNYIVTALDAEARVFIEHYRLKRDATLPYTVYKGEDTLLLITGMGKTNAMMALSALLGYRLPGRNDNLINIGICGAPSEYALGEALLIHQLLDEDRRYYPDILYTHTLRETSLICVNSPVESPLSFPVDMESTGVFQAASKFFKLHRMAFVKIVSDHCQPDTVTKEGVVSLMKSHLGTFDSLLSSLQNVAQEQPLFSEQEFRDINLWKSYFTVAQGVQLEDAFCYFRLKDPARPFPFPKTEIPVSKRERSVLLESFIATLTA